jgi:general secretion pathway protein G
MNPGARRSFGFTLIELLITVAIVGVLASAAMPLFEVSAQRAKEQDLRRALIQLREGIDAYKRATEERRVASSADQSGYPPTLKALVEGVPDAKHPDGAKIYFMRRIPRDPFAEDPAAAPESAWGLRSYDSPSNQPRPGKDVFDVYSQSADKGLNGVPYREW